MFVKVVLLMAVCLVSVGQLCYAAGKKGNGTLEVDIYTNKGKIRLALYSGKAPKTVENFLSYVKDGHYEGTVFHRVIDGFMIQGGGFTTDMEQKPVNDPITNEADNGLQNVIGTIAMARTMDVNSATCQFYINAGDNYFLDHHNNTPSGFGYCVFGEVVGGMDVVEAINKAKTGSKGYLKDVPDEAITIERVAIVE